MKWKIYSWEDPKFGSTEVQIKLSRESGKKGSFSSWDFREEAQCENLPAVTSGCHFCRAVSLLFGLNAVLSSPACMQDLSIFRICLFVNISWVNLPAFVPSNRHEWTPRRFWFTNPDGTAFSEAAPPSAFYPWLRGFYSSRSAPLRVNLSNLTSGRSGEEPRFSEVGGIVQKLHTVGSVSENCSKLHTVGSVSERGILETVTKRGGVWKRLCVFVSVPKWHLCDTTWHPTLLWIRRLSFEEVQFRENLSLCSLSTSRLWYTELLHVTSCSCLHSRDLVNFATRAQRRMKPFQFNICAQFAMYKAQWREISCDC